MTYAIVSCYKELTHLKPSGSAYTVCEILQQARNIYTALLHLKKRLPDNTDVTCLICAATRGISEEP